MPRLLQIKRRNVYRFPHIPSSRLLEKVVMKTGHRLSVGFGDFVTGGAGIIATFVLCSIIPTAFVMLDRMNRRSALKLGTGLTVIAGAGLYGGYELLPPGPSRTLEPADVLAHRLCDSLDAEQRAETCVPYDHPMRQYHNRGVGGGGREVFMGFSRRQRRILTDLLYAGLSEEGRARIPQQDLIRWTGIQSMRALICGDPASPPYQVIFTGVHLNLRVGGKSREGAALGGPQIYGDQRGNNRQGLPGNVYREQFVIAQRLLHSLDEGRRKHAVLEEAPVQTQIELQGRHGAFPGIPVAELKPEGKALVRTLAQSILAAYPAEDVAYAHECLDANGGTESLYLSYYQHGEDGDIYEAQVFRLEGPSAVFYFRGFPHLHAFINIAMDGDSPISAGEPLANNPEWLDRAAVKALFEAALRAQTRADLAYYDESSVAGRLRPGLIRSGDIYTLESWQENAETVEIRGRDLSPAMQAALRDQHATLDPDKIYTIGTTGYVASNESEKLGRIQSRRPGPMLRDLTVEYLRVHGFPAT